MTDQAGVGSRPPSPPTPSSAPAPLRRSVRRRVLWLSIAGGCVAAALIAVFAASPQQSSVGGDFALRGKVAPLTSGSLISTSGVDNLAALRGKWVFVNFFASWCPPCQTEMPFLEQFQQAHAAAGDATVFGVEFDPKDASSAKSFLAGRSADWPAINDPSADVTWGVHNPPESYLVSPSGIVVEKVFGPTTDTAIDSAIAHFSGVAGS
jgi:cytochrome c biogenesis protein CcmG/thiol:disulfide interchange protein DsbE